MKNSRYFTIETLISLLDIEEEVCKHETMVTRGNPGGDLSFESGGAISVKSHEPQMWDYCIKP